MLSTPFNDLNTSAKWDGSHETHDGYKAWVNDVSLWANINLREQFLDEAQAACEKLLAEIQRSAETDTGDDVPGGTRLERYLRRLC